MGRTCPPIQVTIGEPSCMLADGTESFLLVKNVSSLTWSIAASFSMMLDAFCFVYFEFFFFQIYSGM